MPYNFPEYTEQVRRGDIFGEKMRVRKRKDGVIPRIMNTNTCVATAAVDCKFSMSSASIFS